MSTPHEPTGKCRSSSWLDGAPTWLLQQATSSLRDYPPDLNRDGAWGEYGRVARSAHHRFPVASSSLFSVEAGHDGTSGIGERDVILSEPKVITEG